MGPRRPLARLAPVLALALVVVPGVALGARRPARAGDSPAPDPVAAAKKVRAALRTPAEGLGFEFQGDLVLDGEGIGTVRYAVDAGVYHDAPVWLVTQEETREFGGSKRHAEISLYLAKDLTLIRGEMEIKTDDDVTRVSFARAGDGFDLVKNVTTAKGAGAPAEFHVPAAADATFGRPALLLFLRDAPKAPATYTLPLFFPELAANAPASEDEVEAASSEATVETKGPAKYGVKPNTMDTWLVAWRSPRGKFDVHLSPKDRSLIAISGLPKAGRVPPVADVVPKGTAPKKAETDDDKPATTWKAAFLKFGHGYHMAIPKYLEAAFHWPTMYENEKTAGSWKRAEGVTPEDDFAQFKKSWVEAFLSESKHRPRADTDALLFGTLATGTATPKGDDTVVFAADAQFGGGVQKTYHLHRIEGVWYIVRIDM